MTYHENCYIGREQFSNGDTSSSNYRWHSSLKNSDANTSTPLKGLPPWFLLLEQLKCNARTMLCPLCVYIRQSFPILYFNFWCASLISTQKSLERSKRGRWARQVARVGEKICIQGLAVVPEGNSRRERCRHRWEYNIWVYCILQFAVMHKENFSFRTR
jgi:hypothetical protein